MATTEKNDFMGDQTSASKTDKLIEASIDLAIKSEGLQIAIDLKLSRAFRKEVEAASYENFFSVEPKYTP